MYMKSFIFNSLIKLMILCLNKRKTKNLIKYQKIKYNNTKKYYYFELIKHNHI